MKPLFKWAGGKSDELEKIFQHIPNNISTYIEPFVGGGSVFFELLPQRAVINDVHKDLVCFYRAIKNGNANDIHQFMDSHANDEETYYDVRSSNTFSDLDIAKKFFYLRKTCYRGMSRYNKRGDFNICFGRYKSIKYDALLDERYEELLKNTEIYNEDFELIFEKFNSAENFMFLDPPYDCEYNNYGFCQFGKDEHTRLANCFKATNIRCLLIIGKTKFIEDLYDGYIVGEYEKRYRIKIHSNRVNAGAVHLIIKNF